MAVEEPAPPNLLWDLLVFIENEQTPTIVGMDVNPDTLYKDPPI